MRRLVLLLAVAVIAVVGWFLIGDLVALLVGGYASASATVTPLP